VKHDANRPPIVILGLVPRIHLTASVTVVETWMAGTSPAMTNVGDQRSIDADKVDAVKKANSELG
jgi:hypothetical protein